MRCVTLREAGRIGGISLIAAAFAGPDRQLRHGQIVIGCMGLTAAVLVLLAARRRSDILEPGVDQGARDGKSGGV